jgi:hypothetical protein
MDYILILYSSEIHSEKNEDDFELRHYVLEFVSAHTSAHTFTRTDFAIFWVVFSGIAAASSFESDTTYIPWKADYGSAIYILVSR